MDIGGRQSEVGSNDSMVVNRSPAPDLFQSEIVKPRQTLALLSKGARTPILTLVNNTEPQIFQANCVSLDQVMF